MTRKGKIIKSDSGHCIRIEEPLIKQTWDATQAKWVDVPGVGGQACAYWATEMNTGQKGVAKIFKKEFANADTIKRTRFLVDQDLHTACPILLAPIEVLHKGDMVGHYTPFADGMSLENHLLKPDSTFIEHMQLAIALSHATSVLHARNIAHGDLQTENLIVNHVGSVLELRVIDLDNFSAPGLPPPPCVGHNLYMSPELRAALDNHQPAVPTIRSELFSLAVLMHEIVLLRHLVAGSDSTDESFRKAMCSGRWLQDPAAADRPTGDLGGYPVEVLNADLARLFRAAVSLQPSDRPSADEWETELHKAFQSVYCCPACGGPCIVDASKVVCPLCKRPFPYLTLRILANHSTIPLNRGATLVGRADLCGSPKASVRHAIFRRVGPELWIESLGSNGTYRWNGRGWTKFPDGKPLLVQNGDRLRLGDVEALLN